MITDIVVIGAGSSGVVTLQIIEDINTINQEWNVLGFVDDAYKDGGELNSYPIFGDIKWLLKNKDIASVISIGSPDSRKKISEYLIKYGYNNFVSLIHPTVVYNKKVSIGKGVVIHPGVLIDPEVRLGNHVFLNKGVSIGHNVQIQNCCVISPNASFGGGVKMGEGVFMGLNSCILPFKKIGSFCTIGAGTVVIQDVDPYSIIVGNPGKVIRTKKSDQ